MKNSVFSSLVFGLILLVCAVFADGQTGTGQSNYAVGLSYVLTAPSGVCAPTAIDQSVIGTGTVWSCQNRVWTQIGGGAALTTTNLLAAYLMPATETSTTVLTDYSGNANNGTFASAGAAPTRLGNGSVSCAGSSSQFITLPSALQAANTWMLAYSYNTGDNYNGTNFAALLAPASAPATHTPWQLGFIKTLSNGVVALSQINAYDVGLTSSPDAVSLASGGQGTHVLTFTHDTTASADRLYLDGIEWPLYASKASLFPWTPTGGVWQLCGSTNNTSFFTGQLHAVAAWSAALTPALVAANSLAIKNLLTQKGVTTSSGSIGLNSVGSVLALNGDSIMQGTTPGVNPVWNRSMTLTGTPNVMIPALAGSQLVSQENPNVPYDTCNDLNIAGAGNIGATNGGTNDIAIGGLNAAQVEGGQQQYCRYVHACGLRCVIATILPQGSVPVGTKNAIASWDRQHWPEFADGLLDWQGDPNLGPDGAQSNATYYFGDNLHPNQWSAVNIQLQGTQRLYNMMTGPKDFSTATTYNSAAPAAQTVTASSQSGNTATYTFTSNAFTVGQYMSCTGITPSGYNATNYNSLTILSAVAGASGTVTAYLNTTGLGAGSVFGSCTVPQQKEERFSILNFGAGNFTILPCDMITGQRLNILNINGSSSTLVAFGPDLFSTGASTLTIATNQVRILEAKTITPSSPVCSWTVIQ